MASELRHELDVLKSLWKFSKDNFFRLPILVIGDQADRNQLADQFLTVVDSKNIIWISAQTPNAYTKLSKLKAINVIGKEYQCIAYDIDNDFDPNLFAALSGTLRGGGLFLILCPPLESWITETKTSNWFMWRFINKLAENDLCIKLPLGENDFNINTFPFKTTPAQTEGQQLKQQNLAIQEIIHVVRGHRNRPLVLLADRGRGKSAALGIAASKLLMSGLTNILITAPSLDACTIVFKHLKLGLPLAIFKKGSVQTGTGKFSFIAPDKLKQETPQASLLIIDEASGIPPPTLEILLRKYSRIVFASTIHGYEGSGYCFPVKFFKYLNKLTPNWKKTVLTHPVRWADGDPLELLTNQLFLLTPQKKQQTETPPTKISQLDIQLFSPEKLVKNERLLSQLYELLSTAHYKTQPSDLLHILNEPNINIFLMFSDEKIIAAAFTICEGKLEESISKEIYLGNRRPKGNIIPQTLAMHLGIEKAAQLSYLRIMRIAVQPEFQKKGLGSKLSKYLIEFAAKNKYSAIACTFSATDQLIHFWGKLKFSILRLGHHRKANSNGYAALMLKSLENSSKETLLIAQRCFQTNFPYQLKEVHSELDYQLVISILENAACQQNFSPTEKDIQDIESYTQGNRQYEDNLAAIHKTVNHAFTQAETFKQLEKPELAILIVKILQQRSWHDTVRILHLSGKKECIQLLKKTISKIPLRKL